LPKDYFTETIKSIRYFEVWSQCNQRKIPGGPKKRGQCIFLFVSFKRLGQI